MGTRKWKRPSLMEVYDSLVKQLEERGANVAHFLDILEKYMFFCEEENRARKEGGSREEMLRIVTKCENGKLKILKFLDLTTDNCWNPNTENEDL